MIPCLSPILTDEPGSLSAIHQRRDQPERTSREVYRGYIDNVFRYLPPAQIAQCPQTASIPYQYEKSFSLCLRLYSGSGV